MYCTLGLTLAVLVLCREGLECDILQGRTLEPRCPSQVVVSERATRLASAVKPGCLGLMISHRVTHHLADLKDS